MRCTFCFTDVLDTADHTGLYDEFYWNNQDPDWHGRVAETLRLVLIANTLRGADPWTMKVLDFGCGMGTFLHTAREKLNMQVWGNDIIEPRFGKEFFLKELPARTFDIIVSCEVLEHLPFPLVTLQGVIRSLKPGGVFAYQTAYYDPKTAGRDWWYVGPGNGHVSLYSAASFDVLFQRLGGGKRLLWNNYPGIQAWQIPSPLPEKKEEFRIKAAREAGAGSRQDIAACAVNKQDTRPGFPLQVIAPEWTKRVYRRIRSVFVSCSLRNP
jgi:SAM-dependent methyltransferase